MNNAIFMSNTQNTQPKASAKTRIQYGNINTLDDTLISLYHLAGNDIVTTEEATAALQKLEELSTTLEKYHLKIKDMKDWAKGCFYLLEARQQHPNRVRFE